MQTKVARAAVKGQRSATRPEVFLQFQREFDDFKPDSRLQVGIRSQFGAGLSSFSGIAQAREAVSSAIALRRSEELAIRERVRADLATLQSFAFRRPALEEAVRTAKQVYESYQRQFLAGSKSWLDVMNSARDLQVAQLQLAEAVAGQLSENGGSTSCQTRFPQTAACNPVDTCAACISGRPFPVL